MQVKAIAQPLVDEAASKSPASMSAEEARHLLSRLTDLRKDIQNQTRSAQTRITALLDRVEQLQQERQAGSR
ncbi:MAG: hypothetical protein ACRDTQ_14675 [Micromonosporaceae bacterium]